MKRLTVALVGMLVLGSDAIAADCPNILWLITEDMGHPSASIKPTTNRGAVAPASF